MTDDATSCSVLLVDDEPIAQDLIEHALSTCRNTVLRYLSDPHAVVQAAIECRATVVLADLRMPGADGFDVIRLLRACPATEHLPIVLLSSEDDPEIKAKAFAAGANDYLVKWPDARELSARVRYHNAASIARRERDQAYADLRRSQDELAASQLALHQTQKMEAIGQLTGGVAHDFNNVLQIIGGNLQLLKLLGGLSETALQRVDTALAGVERGARLSSHLLAFARRQPLRAVLINPAALLADMDEMLRSVLGPRIDLRIEVTPEVWSTTADPSQLTNVLLNLAMNARDAMGSGGVFTVRVANVACSSDQLSSSAEGDYVMLEVADNGCGMPPSVRQRAFEPFFTTKRAGHGAGLGLSMVYGFVKQSGGEITLTSEPGQGTSVRIFLRRGADVAVPVERSAVPELAPGNETILVVEDEDDVRASTVALLSALGYRVLEAPDAASAAAQIEAGLQVDLVFSDVIMPGEVTSLELSSLVRRKLPSAQMLFTSGYAEGVLAHEGRVDPGVNLLQKPYTADVLSARIRRLLVRRREREIVTG